MPNNPVNSRGTGFTNLQSYLQANKQNRLGRTIGAGISSAANRATTDLSQAQQQFQGGAERGDLATEANRQAREAVLNRISATGQMLPQPSQSVNSDVSDQEAQDFAKYRAGQYSGPKELGNQVKLQQEANKAEALGRGLGTQAGRQGLLQQFVGVPQYTSGQQTLDSLLLGRSPGLAQAKQQTIGLTQAVGRGNQLAAATAAQKQAQAQKFAQETMNMIQGQKQGISTPLEQQLSEQQKAQQDALARIQAGSPTTEFTQQDIDMLGLSPGQELYDINVGQNLSPVLAPTLGGLASEQQKAQLGALAKLSGQDVGQFFQGFDPKAMKFDPSHSLSLRPEFQQAVESRGKEIEGQVSRAPTDLSGAIKQLMESPNTATPTVKGQPMLNFYQYGNMVPDWMKNPSQFKDIAVGQAESKVNDAEKQLNEQMLPAMYEELTGRRPNGPITPEDISPRYPINYSALSQEKWNNMYNLAKQMQENIANAKQTLTSKKAEIGKQYGAGHKVKVKQS